MFFMQRRGNKVGAKVSGADWRKKKGDGERRREHGCYEGITF
jgi:hypothetical protein